jgi:integrase
MARKKGTFVPIDGIKSYRSKGKMYSYDRESGVRLKSAPGTPEFAAEVQAVRGLARDVALRPGTLGAVIAIFKATDAVWDLLKPKTQLSYERAFSALEPIKNAPMSEMTRASIISFRDSFLFAKRGRWMANYCLTVMSVLFGFAQDRGIVRANPLQGRIKKIRKPPGAPKANRAWTADELNVVFGAAPHHIKLPLAMAACLGLRFTDIMTAPMSAIRDGVAWLDTSKTGQMIKVPIHPVLADALAARPASEAVQICLTSDRKPWKSGFNASWTKFRKSLEAEGKIATGLTLHGLRHTLGKMLKEAGLSDGAIADVLGQSSIAMARHYSDEAELPLKSREVVLELDWPGKRETQ